MCTQFESTSQQCVTHHNSNRSSCSCSYSSRGHNGSTATGLLTVVPGLRPVKVAVGVLDVTTTGGQVEQAVSRSVYWSCNARQA